VPYTTPAVFTRLKNEAITGRVEEISEGGAQFVARVPIDPSTPGTLKFSLPMTGKACLAKVSTRWAKAGRNGFYAVGLEFKDLDASSSAVVKEYVRLMGPG
jgi:hypothetical protein